MGTQQILLIVLSVIIVGVAIAVGISMFNSQSYNSNKTAIASDAQSFATQAVQYYKTPMSQGGAGGADSLMTADKVATFLSFQETGNKTTNENGTYTITSASGTQVVITGVGTAKKGGTNPKNPQVVTTVALPEGTVTAVASDVDAP